MIKLNKRQTDVLFAMIRAGLWNDIDLETLTVLASSLHDEEWKTLFCAVREQAVTGIFTDGLKLVTERTAGGEFAYLNGVMWMAKLEKRNRLLVEAVGELKKKYPGGWIFKGPQLIKYYPFPLHRETGDVDVIVPGLKEEINYTFTFQGKAIVVELHPWPEYLTSPCKNRKLQAIIAREQPEQRGELSLEVNLLCMILHVRRHVLSDGFGLKQLCDIAVILQNQPYDKERLLHLIRQTGCETFTACLMKFLAEELGVPNVCPTRCVASEKSYRLLWNAILEEGYDNKQAWRESSGWMESAKLRWQRCWKMYPLVGSEAWWMLFYRAVHRREREYKHK